MSTPLKSHSHDPDEITNSRRKLEDEPVKKDCSSHQSPVNANENDGIPDRAEEIAGLNLGGVDWAVLSACDTGVGEIRVGEGVFGLRRAFQVAGAKTVIMSLWPIEDETAGRCMETLYHEHFVKREKTRQRLCVSPVCTF